MAHHVIKPVRDTEEIRSVDLVHLYARRDCQVLQVQSALRVFVRIDLVVESADMRFLVRTHEE